MRSESGEGVSRLHQSRVEGPRSALGRWRVGWGLVESADARSGTLERVLCVVDTARPLERGSNGLGMRWAKPAQVRCLELAPVRCPGRDRAWRRAPRQARCRVRPQGRAPCS